MKLKLVFWALLTSIHPETALQARKTEANFLMETMGLDGLRVFGGKEHLTVLTVQKKPNDHTPAHYRKTWKKVT